MLPKILHPTNSTKLPSSGATIKFRPMQAREEKILLHAKESSDDSEILSVVSEVVQNCVMDPSFRAADAPIFDVEWLFVRIRMASVSPVSEVSYIDRSDQKQYDFQIDLDSVGVKRDPDVAASFKVTDDVAVELRWPTVGDYLRAGERVRAEDVADELVLSSIGKVYQGDAVTDAQKEPREELQEFVDSLGLDNYHSVVKWVDAVPHLYHEIKYVNSKGEERRIVLQKLTDFFVFR